MGKRDRASKLSASGIAVLSFLLITGAVPVASTAAPSEAFPEDVEQEELPDAGPDEIEPVPGETELLEAQRTGMPVEVRDLTSEYQLVEALPDGAMRLTSNTMPARVKQADEWVPVDPTLLQVQGRLEPVATTLPVSFSAGGDDTLARIQLHDGSWMEEIWPLGPLPTPTLAGASATYDDVLPGIDLILEATTTGMRETLVIESPEAAAHPDLAGLSVALEGADISISDEGTVTARPIGAQPSDADLISSLPVLWDSSSEESSIAGPGLGGALEVVEPEDGAASRSSETRIGLVPGNIAEREDLIYPVFIDPDWTGSSGGNAWYIDDRFPDAIYPRYGVAGVNNYAPVGYLDAIYDTPTYDKTWHRWRSFWRHDLSPLVGKEVTRADFNLTEIDNFTCSDPVAVHLNRATSTTPGGSWNQHLSAGLSLIGSWGGCGASPVGFDVDSTVSSIVGSGGSSVDFALIAADESVSTQTFGFRKFSWDTNLIVEYNTKPSTPQYLSIQSPERECAPQSSPAYVPSSIPLTFRARISDPDGGNLIARLQVQRLRQSGNPGGNGAWVNALTTSAISGPQMAGGFHSITIESYDTRLSDSNREDGLYRWRFVASDGSLESAPSAYCYMYFDNVPPKPPIVTPPPSSQTLTIGQPFEVTVQSEEVTDQPMAYQYYWESGTSSTPEEFPLDLVECDRFGIGKSRFACARGMNPVELVVAPIYESGTLWVRTIDAAGLVSQPPVGVVIHGDPDTNSISFDSGGGHGWRQLEPGSTIEEVIEDENLMKPIPLPLPESGSFTSVSSKPFLLFHPVLDISDYVPLNVYSDLNGAYIDTFGSGGQRGYKHVAEAGWAKKPGEDYPSLSTRRLCQNKTTKDVRGLLHPQACNSTSEETVGFSGVNSTDVAAPALALKLCSGVGAQGKYLSTGTCTGTTTALGWVAGFEPMSTDLPPVDTSDSFSVSAYLKPDYALIAETGAYLPQIAISQASQANAGFTLGTNAGRQWEFCLTEQRSGASTKCTTSTNTAGAGWKLVTGVWDKHNQQLRIYVDDAPEPAGTVTWRAPHAFEDGSATGGLTVGSAEIREGNAHRWFGEISGPVIFPGVISQDQREALKEESSP